MENFEELTGKLITLRGQCSCIEVAPLLEMDLEKIIKDHEIPQKMIAEKAGIKYQRFRNCMSRDNYSFNDEEKKAIAKAIVEWLTNVLNALHNT